MRQKQIIQLSKTMFQEDKHVTVTKSTVQSNDIRGPIVQ